jgi:uncharacterized protein YndB with AHSA1/START domain
MMSRPEQNIRINGLVDAPAADVWRAFSTSEGAETFFAQRAHIGLSLGGPYEIFFNPADERQGLAIGTARWSSALHLQWERWRRK